MSAAAAKAPPRRRLAIYYAVLTAVTAAVVAVTLSIGSGRHPQPNIAGTYSVINLVPGNYRVTVSKALYQNSVKTLNGQSLRVRVKNGDVTVGGVRVVKTNIAASNGVIHVIDGVLIPH